MSEFRRLYEPNKKLEVDLSNPRYRLLLMDFHGTIADRQLWSLKGLTETWKSTFGYPAPRYAYRQTLMRENMTHRQHLQKVLDEDDRIDLPQKEEARGGLSRTFEQHMKDIYLPTPGMRKVMRSMLDAGINIAILTNGAQTADIQASLLRWGMPELVESVYNGPLMNCKKPDPRAVEYIVEDMYSQDQSFDYRDILMVGDQFDDTEVAVNAKIDSALMIRPVQTKTLPITYPHPSYVIDNPFDLMDIVAGHVEPLPAEDGEVTVHPPFFYQSTR